VIIRDDEYLDFSAVPESRGVPNFLYRVLAIGLLCIFAIGAACVLLSGYGHEWPANHTLRTPLGNLTE
jgi:hypothetical protein